ncbi:MAG TPA: glycosyltransferase [Solirubrobacteraceae bacterium]|jgi:GT2 family glycosyltransferase|nr:glycosyltransferase [Solirubrobacteraceae bacterium]
MSNSPTEGRPVGALANLRRRIYLTYRYFGLRTILFRVVTFPLRFTPLQRRLRLRTHARDQELRRAVEWYREHGRPVDIVIPSYRDAEHVRVLVRSLLKTVPKGMARVIVADDCSGPEHLAALRQVKGIDLVIDGETNAGFAANVNRGLRASAPDRDVVVLNSDTEALPSWLECLQYAAHRQGNIGIVGGQLQYPDGRIQFGGTVRNRDQPQWFDHRYRFKPAGWGPADQTSPALAVTGACMYVRREAIERVGLLDERYGMAYEDVDWCLRAWQAGLRVIYFPAAQLIHHESITRGTELGARERTSQERFWERWAAFFDERDVRSEDGRLRIVYVTEDTGVGGGHRDIFEHLNRLQARGHDASLYTLGDPPEWFPLQVPVRSFADYDELANALAEVDAIKVATWWMTAVHVWRASIPRGIPVYFVQDIETSYYPDHERARHAVLDSYRPEFRYMTISNWNRERLHELDLDAELIPPGIDLETFRPRPEVERRSEMVLALGRSNPLKNLPLTLAAWRALKQPRPELCMFGIEPELADEEGMRYVVSPDDEQVGELFSQATVFVQTSTHEGFALPPLEAMATGAAVVCTDAHGNRDFCVEGVNCLMPAPDVAAVTVALEQLLADPELRKRLGKAGIETAQEYAWERRIDALEAFFERVAAARTLALAGELAATG